MNEQERADSQATTARSIGGGATDSDREAVAREIGAQLKEGREAQRLSIEDVGARLKVAPGKLRAIESGDVSSLTDVTFAKGVMRAYARTLQIDIDALLGRYHAQAQATPVTGITRRHEGALNQAFDDRNRFGKKAGGAGGRWLWLLCVVALVVFGGYFGYDHVKAWLDARTTAAAEAPATAPAEDAATQQNNGDGTVTAALPPVMVGDHSPAPSESASAVETPAKSTTALPAVPTTSSGMPLATGGALAPAPQAAASQSAAAPAANVPAAAPGTGAVQIRFSADSWYEVRDRSGKVILGGTGKAGETVAGSGAGGPYKVVIGNVKGVESMAHNGAPVDVQAANRNNVARLTLQ
ncbi:RodZ domain-containing protein [Cupriavidus agavae]|uniref:Cytoskeleton protein RodZ n=1 Tax=Cupriavidus agavae TaxID=1001822 RepID=A0A4Q7S622_9BURK|nr:RodZ domain-containing protein [Cupriavidus agavae]RZT41824.1 cytoskeleton protein RodZ [Cupriavidus agavae]